jgi:LysM repeat protein
MRKWTTSACLVIASCVLPLVAAAGSGGPSVPQASTSIASSSTSSTRAIPADQPATTTVTLTAFIAAPKAVTEPAGTWTVRPGDTLSSIATALAVPGGWPALYAANKQVIGPDPDIISAGATLTLPSQVPGNAKVPSQSYQASHNPAAQQRQPQGKAPAARAVPAGGTVIVTEGVMPRWLKLILLLAGLLTLTSFLIEPVAVVARRRRRAAQAAAQTAHADEPLHERLSRSSSRIIQADHDRLIVTYSAHDDTVYLLTPPGEDPWTVLRAARVVVPEATYVELADHLGVPSVWPYE